MSQPSIVNRDLIAMALASLDAQTKQAFIPGGDPSMDPNVAAGGGFLYGRSGSRARRESP